MKLNNLNFKNQTFQVYVRSQADKSVLKEIFELKEYKIVESIIKSAKQPIIDAGAQAGFFVLYARALNLNVRILALEPDEKNVELLNRHLELNKINNVEVINAALTGKSGLRDFYLSKDTHNHSLIKDYLVGIEKKVKVQGLSLADLLDKYNLNKISLLKLDIEGAEYEVLQSLADNDWSKIEVIFLEYHDFGKFSHAQLEKKLRDHNFKIDITASKFDKSLGFIFAIK